MIFVALGTHEQPFERALDLIEPLATEYELVIQHGATPTRDLPHAQWFAFTDYERMQSLIREASHVVCHAGVGVIMTTLRERKTPIVIPRLARFGEHVDDHQLQISSAFAMTGRVAVCTSGDISDAFKAAEVPPPDLAETGAFAATVWRDIAETLAA